MASRTVGTFVVELFCVLPCLQTLEKNRKSGNPKTVDLGYLFNGHSVLLLEELNLFIKLDVLIIPLIIWKTTSFRIKSK